MVKIKETITEQEAAAIIDDLASLDCKVKFSHYYKYNFTFLYENNKVKVTLDFGGNIDDIYRYELSNNQEISIAPFYQLHADWHYVTVELKDGSKNPFMKDLRD